MFGCKPVIDADNLALRRTGKAAAGRVGQIQIADHPAPAVKIDARPQKLPQWNITADRNGPMLPANRLIDHARQFRQAHRQWRCGHRGTHHGPALFGCDLVEPRPSGGGISL